VNAPAPALSVVIPAFNEAARLPATLARVRAYLAGRGTDFEIVVADDGSRDATAALAEAAGARLVQSATNRGKGHAVRHGMLAARGARRLMTDADLSTPIEDLALLEQALAAGADVAVASRALAASRVEVHQPALRELSGRVFNLLVRALLLPGLADTQCGFKLFTAEAANEAFARCRIDGFSFDVEALYVARRLGRRVVEVPVTWRNDAATRVTLARGVLAFADLLRIRANAVAGRYRGPAAGSL
jgi:dolichyl-phosphate beta-glucosyltransferase